MSGKMSSGKNRALGISRLKIGFIALFVIFGGLLAGTKYFDLSLVVEESMEQGVIEAVRQGVAEYAVISRGKGRSTIYPPLLDDAEPGAATPQNLFFSHILQRGIAVEGWEKTGQNEYRAPTGEKYVYDPRTGSFETRGSMAATDMEQSSKTPRLDGGGQ